MGSIASGHVPLFSLLHASEVKYDSRYVTLHQ
jgi:hypothetical protein